MCGGGRRRRRATQRQDADGQPRHGGDQGGSEQVLEGGDSQYQGKWLTLMVGEEENKLLEVNALSRGEKSD